jgi:superkiller protein 3
LDIYNQNQDVTKTAETLQKYVEEKRQVGDKLQIVDALALYLPGSPHHELLLSLPVPDPTQPTATSTFESQTAIHNSLHVLQEIVRLTEEAETRTFDQEFQKRRMRLNAPSPEQLKKAIGVEIFGSSKLPTFYNELINHPSTSDEERRTIEAKLLRRKIQYLRALPSSDKEKSRVSREVLQMADDVVLLKVPDELAWKLHIDHQDMEHLEDYNHETFSRYIGLFPESPLASFLRGYLSVYNAGAQQDEHEEGSCHEDPYELMMDAFTSLQNDLFPTRVIADIYLQDQDYRNSAKLAEIGLEIVRKIEINDSTTLAQ